MVEKRRGLGRGLGALIPSGPAEAAHEAAAPAVPDEDTSPRRDERTSGRDSGGQKKQSGRPADLFFERVTEEDVVDQPRSYSSALRSGINKNVLDAQTKRVAKSSGKKTTASRPKVEPETAKESAPGTESTTSDRAGQQDRSSETEHARSAPESFDGDARESDAAESGASTDPATSASPAESSTTADAAPSSDGGTESGPGVAMARTHHTVPRETSEDVIPPSEEELAPVQPRSDQGLVEVPGVTFADVRLDDIHPNRKQPRVEFDEDELAELVHSIREIGVLQPIVVRPSQEGGDAAYELVMGERRWRASREAGKETVPAIIRSTLDDDLLRDALLENLHRSALNPLEEAAAYQQLLDDFGCSHDELAGRLGRSRPQISNTLRLMKLPPLVQRRLAAGVLSAGHARALLGLDDAAEMEKLAQRIVAEGLSVRSTEEIVALSGGLRRATRASTPRDGARHERLDYLATSLSDRLDTNVKITLGAKKGRVSIEFASVDDLNRIVGVLAPSPEQ